MPLALQPFGDPLDPCAVLLGTDRNGGYTGGNNVGIRRALADGAGLVLVLNNDIHVRPGCVDNLIEALDRHPRLGLCLDTCHLFASGKDIASSPEAQRAVLDEYERVIGERPGFFHLNDSQHPFGSNKDRHACIGDGLIGAEPFRWLLADPRSGGIPLVLETPQERSGIAEDDVSADPADERMMTLLRSFLPT